MNEYKIEYVKPDKTTDSMDVFEFSEDRAVDKFKRFFPYYKILNSDKIENEGKA